MNASERRDPLTYRIIGAAIEVHRVLGPGLLESLYEDAFCYELYERGIAHERQKRILVDYKGRKLGNLVADVVVQGQVIVELKSVEQLAPIHITQMLTYLKVTNIRRGLLFNFNVRTLFPDGVKRYIL